MTAQAGENTVPGADTSEIFTDILLAPAKIVAAELSYAIGGAARA
jgi:hypothetical protein